jgi:hypothetical protein
VNYGADEPTNVYNTTTGKFLGTPSGLIGVFGCLVVHQQTTFDLAVISVSWPTSLARRHIVKVNACQFFALGQFDDLGTDYAGRRNLLHGVGTEIRLFKLVSAILVRCCRRYNDTGRVEQLDFYSAHASRVFWIAVCYVTGLIDALRKNTLSCKFVVPELRSIMSASEVL